MNFLERIKGETKWIRSFDKIISLDRGDLGRKYSEEYDSMIDKVGAIDVLNSWGFSDLIDDEEFEVTIVNFASQSHVDTSIKNPFTTFISNSILIPSLIQDVGVDNIKTFYHIRTDEEFGQLTEEEAGYFSFNNNSPLNPRNPYSASKASQKLFLDSLKETFNLDVKYFVLSNQYGGYQHEEKFIPSCIKAIQNGEKIKIYGDGSNMREWCFVEDTVDIIFKVISEEVLVEDDVMITNPEGFKTNNEVVRLILDGEDFDSNVEYVEDRKGHDFAYSITKNFNYRMTSFEEGLKLTKNFYTK